MKENWALNIQSTYFLNDETDNESSICSDRIDLCSLSEREFFFISGGLIDLVVESKDLWGHFSKGSYISIGWSVDATNIGKNC